MNDFKQPIDLLADENPTTCPFDGARLDQIEQRDEYTIEICLCCGKLFNVWDE